MSSPKDLEQRVSAIEADLAVVRQEGAAARELAAGADREAADVRAELRGHGRVLTALRETQLEMQVEMQGMQLEMRGMQLDMRGMQLDMRGFREIQVRHYAEHKADAAEMKAGMAQIVRMLEDLSGDGRSPRSLVR
ncbi:hypothetical protein ACIA5C_33775 [Actinoplanes sp. NPDC051343]|uniref:hypothetical protein n=1 Tax=Actinoplanes sp. NPDC051343 TaxID=3363906 RepID=UPI0037AE396E